MDQEQIKEILKSKDGKRRLDIRQDAKSGKCRIGIADRWDGPPPGNIHDLISVEYPDLATARVEAQRIISQYERNQKNG